MEGGMKQIMIRIVLIAGCLAVFGCTTTGVNQDMSVLSVPEGVAVPPALQPDYAMGQSAEGSLWNEGRGSIYEDTRANYVGDTVIVDIVENSSSSMDVNSDSSRDSSMSIGIPTMTFGNKTTTSILGPLSAPGGTMLGTSFSNSVTGEAESDRSGQVTASIAARVVEVLPNGNLSLFGRRAMKVDNEVQYIVVTGVVRPQDISASNRVDSTYLADSRIEYYGKGALSDKQKPGWGTRLIDNIWPW